ncbi:MAG: hypothetical protein ACWGMZ_00845 [Thermoguttaceae bacterium]
MKRKPGLRKNTGIYSTKEPDTLEECTGPELVAMMKAAYKTSPDFSAIFAKRIASIKKFANELKDSPRKYCEKLKDEAAALVMDDACEVLKDIKRIELSDQKSEAAYFSINLGKNLERLRIRAIGAENLARIGRVPGDNRRRHREQQIRDREKLYKEINSLIEEKVKKRGNRRQPSLTAIRKSVADSLNITTRTVLNAQKKW